MGKLTVKAVEAKIKGVPGRFADGDGLYLVVPKSGKPYWMLRYTANSKRKEMTLSRCADLSLADARAKAAETSFQHRNGLDPLLARKREAQISIKTVDDLFADWYPTLVKKLKFPTIPERVYRKDIAPHIGQASLKQISARDIRTVLQAIVKSNRPTIANDALIYCKQLFNHGIKLDVIDNNPASAFSYSDAGGEEKSKNRFLSKDELVKFFRICRENSDSFSRENYLACALLVTLGVRKSELAQAPWQEFDLSEATWKLPKERSKSGVPITIPLPTVAVKWLKELQVRAFDSKYVFPNRRNSQHPYMGADTLNRAISKLFGREPGKKKKPPNKMGDMPHFTVHDLRRTCRSLLAANGVSSHVAERCLNHKLKGVEGVYNQYDYLDERREALENLSSIISPLVD
ncbi:MULTISPECIES: tyrosine-type recombinase/integrase [unclassified Colwellia]|uniref:tyrosine-type recombinase/integrase n=1 Tax=unclassified Colwellia TaxID=196834 RepID=UPI0015F5F29C|nr:MULTISPECIES: site-specific integrase [unclassified Colwellia]MBA6257443.1 tyrosine-type recombinase/integrase [Colwellia sp. MB3u-28]MBA6260515.1 tyrosine-type recombinase/integrase [Colwellia sp. MB3u-41]